MHSHLLQLKKYLQRGPVSIQALSQSAPLRLCSLSAQAKACCTCTAASKESTRHRQAPCFYMLVVWSCKFCPICRFKQIFGVCSTTSSHSVLQTVADYFQNYLSTMQHRNQTNQSIQTSRYWSWLSHSALHLNDVVIPSIHPQKNSSAQLQCVFEDGHLSTSRTC